MHGRVDEPKGDPGNTLSRAELEDKALRLAAYHGGASADEMRRIVARIDGLAEAAVVPAFFGRGLSRGRGRRAVFSV